jgi:CRISPR-associated protein Cas1
MKLDLQAYSRFEDRSPFVYVEHTIVEQYQKSIALIDKDGKTPLPVCNIGCLLIGPGTNITHQAVLNATQGGCTLIWTGEEGVRFYASGFDVYGKSKNMLSHAVCYADEKKRICIARKMYQMRFDDIIPDDYNLYQIRGLEGNRVRSAYKMLSEKYGVEWKGRKYDRNDWDFANPINRAITAANSCLYGISTSAIVSLGYSPQIGFIHSGFSTAFSCDIADLYKISEFLPIAFKIVSEDTKDVERRVRYACRDYIKETKFMKRIVADIKGVFDDSADC